MRNDMKRLTAVVLLVLWSHGRLQKSNAAPNAQAAEFNALCSILELANRGLTIAGVTTPPSIQTYIKFLTALNLSLEPDEFFNQNFKRTGDPKGENEEWTEHKATWAELQENIKTGKKGSLDAIIGRVEGEHRREAARQVVNATIAKVASLKASLKATSSSRHKGSDATRALWRNEGDIAKTRHNICFIRGKRRKRLRWKRRRRKGGRDFASQRLRVLVRRRQHGRHKSVRRQRSERNGHSFGGNHCSINVHQHNQIRQ
uniref:Variant surface glycoprotein 1125.1608 n=1 Tax=Trypanosoma brucei TaxID=5691 RepID=A0A1J0R7D2_9TRYP|nr:variant surface glycoprotein 1125.1608 [Trypanosoma brucei]